MAGSKVELATLILAIEAMISKSEARVATIIGIGIRDSKKE
jgi:hypothetical protein